MASASVDANFGRETQLLTLCLKVGESFVIGDGTQEDCVVVHVDRVTGGANGGQQKAFLSVHAPHELRVRRLEVVLREMRDQQLVPSNELKSYLAGRRSPGHQKRR